MKEPAAGVTCGSDAHDWCPRFSEIMTTIPIGSMYGIYANIGGILMVNVTIYTIHGSYGIGYCELDDVG